MNLSQKEKLLLEDQKSHEELCVKKYNEYSNRAEDPQLTQLFKTYAQEEQQHLDTVNQLLSGQIPNMNQQGQQNQEPQNTQRIQQKNSNISSQSDAMLCSDLLMTEKHVSGTYDTAIFEFRDPQIRDLLNHIQKEEQQHGEGIFKYMESKGMYEVK